MKVWRGAKAGQLFDRLMRWTIFAQTDRVVRVDMDNTLLHQCPHSYGITCVFHKHQEGRHVRDKSAMQSDTIGNSGHTKFTHTVIDVVARSVVLDTFGVFKQGEVRAG